MSNEHVLSRRQALGLFSSLGLSYAVPVSILRQSEQNVFAASIMTKDFPLASLATCSQLRAQVENLDQELTRLRMDFTGVGKEVRERFTADRQRFQKSVKDAQKELENTQIDVAFASINVALSVVVIALGYSLTSPLAVGVLAATTVVTGTLVFGVQAYLKTGESAPALFAGYASDRALLFAQLGGEAANSTTGRLLGRLAGASTWFILGYEVLASNGDKNLAMDALKRAQSELATLDATVTRIGENTARWADIYQKQLIATRAGLKAFIDSTQKYDCRLPLISGPTIRTP